MEKYLLYLREQYEFLEPELANTLNQNYIFESDKNILNSNTKAIRVSNKNCIIKETDFLQDLIPVPVLGDIRNGKIFICGLNPGFRLGEKRNEYIEELDPDFKQHMINFLKQDSKTNLNNHCLNNKITINGKTKNFITAGSNYWNKKFDQGGKNKSIVQNVIEKYKNNGIITSKDEIFDLLSRITVFLELVPYHSSKFKYNKKIIDLESVKQIKRFVHEYLIPKAKDEEIFLEFMRSISLWGIDGMDFNQYKTLEINCNGRNPTLAPEYSKLFGYIAKITGNFTIEPGKI